MHANRLKIYQFKAKDLEIKPYLLCLGNMVKTFAVNNMKNMLNEYLCDFSVDYDTTDISDICIFINI